MKKILLHIILPVIFFISVLTSSAQNLGITGTGTTSYPQTTIGNTLTEAGTNAGNNLIFNSVTTTVPLTAISIRTYGSANGTISVTIYNDNSGTPGTKLFTEISASVTAGTLSTITIPTPVFLAAGTYWLAYNMNSNSSTANYITKSTGVTGFVRKFVTLTYGTSFPDNPSVGNLTSGFQDHISFVGVPIQGYAKATKASLGTNGIFSTVNFYSHAAGNVRLAIYNDVSGSPSAKQWESGDITITATGQPKLTTVNISAGTPAILNLTTGTYWLVWQWNSANSGPSYTAGSSGDGNFIVQSYGAFPTNWTGGTSSIEKWSMYATYTTCTAPNPPAGTNGSTCGTGTVNISATPGAGETIDWYGSSTGTASLLSSGNTNFTTPGLSTTTIYYAEARTTTGGCVSATRTAVTAAVNPIPVASVDAQSNITCFAANDGMITVKAANGSLPVSYLFSVDGDHQPTPTWQAATIGSDKSLFTGLLPNHAYRIKVKDNSTGCVSK